jgi:hypothetical protein
MSIRSRKARDAYASRDSDMSRAIHQCTELAELAAGKSDFLHGVPPSSNFTLSNLSAALRGTLAAGLLSSCLVFSSPDEILRTWLVGILALSSLSFFAAWMDDKFSLEFMDFEKQRERWEVDNFPEGEIQEMLHIYTGYGLSESDAETVAKTLAKYPDFWVDHMLLHEIGIVPRRDHEVGDDDSWTSIVIPYVLFFAPFIAPSSVICTGLPVIWGWILCVLQGGILFLIKRQKSQWLAISSVCGIAVAFALTSCLVMLAARVVVSFT